MAVEKQNDSNTEEKEEVKKHPLEDEFVSMFPYTPRTYIQNKLAKATAWMERRQLQKELDMWSTRITAQEMVDLYEDPATYFFCQERKPESELYRSHSLAGLMEEFPFQNTKQIKMVFRREGHFFAPARRALLLRPNTRKTRRPEKYVVRLSREPCVTFMKERRFCVLEDEIAREMEKRRVSREQLKIEARTAGLLEECPICLVPDCLPSDMISCMAGHKFCKTCVITTAEGVLARGRGMVLCLGQCDLEVDVNQLQKVVKPDMLSKLIFIRQAEELKSAGLENLVSCPYCPYQTIMDNQEDKVMRCLNPECGRDSCRMCKHSSHIPYSCKEYQEDVLDAIRKRVEEELTMSWVRVRQCWNCNVNIERTGGGHIMTCPKCHNKTCYVCRKPIQGLHDIACWKIFGNNNALHQAELAKAEERIKSQLSEDTEEILNDLFQPSTSKK